MSKIISTEVFTFDELSEKAKEIARDWYREGNDIPFLAEYMEEELQRLLEPHGVTCKDAKIFYNFSYSQGDGAMFEGNAYWNGYRAKIKQSGHYYHYNSKTIELFREIDGQEVEASADDEAAFNTLYVQICQDLSKAGYAYIDDAYSAEVVDESILANGYTFTSDGKRFG